MHESIPQEEFTIEKAMIQIMAIEQRMRQEGSVDVEPDQLRVIKEKLQKGEIAPVDAVSQAQGILDSMQSYH